MVWRAGALGDFLLTLPLLRGLRSRGQRLLLAARPEFAALLPPELTPDIFLDATGLEAARLFSPDEDPAFSSPSSPIQNPKSQITNLPALLAPILPQAAFLAFNRPDAELEARLRRAGCREVRWIEPRPAGPTHAALAFLRDAGLPAPPDLLRTPQMPPRSGRGQALWLHPGSGSPRKHAPISGFVRLAVRWQARGRGPITVSFGEADAAVRGPALAALADAGVDFRVAEGLTPAELQARLRNEARFYAGNDSGVSHLAAANGVSSLLFFTVTAPAVWRPLGPCRCVR